MPTEFRRSRHLCTAIDHREFEHVLEVLRFRKRSLLQPEHKLLLKIYKRRMFKNHNKNFFQSVLTKYIMSNHVTFSDSTSHPSLAKGILSSYRAFEVSFKCMLDNSLEKPDLPFSVGDLLTDRICHLYHWKREMISVIQRVACSTELEVKIRMGKVKLHFVGNFCIMKLHDEVYPATYNEFLAVSSIVNSHFQSLMYCKIADLTKKYDVSMYDFALRFFDAGLSDLYRWGNQAQNIFKSLPSLAIATINLYNDKVINGGPFYASMMDGLLEYQSGELIQLMTEPARGDDYVHMLLEFSGLYKCFGFPIIDVEETISYMHELITASPGYIGTYARHIRNVFVKYFMKEYLKQNGVYPDLAVVGDVPDELSDAIVRNEWTERGFEGWPADWFEGIILKKTLDFDYLDEESNILSDKSIIPDLEAWIHEYDRNAMKLMNPHLKNHDYPKRQTNRLLVEYLTKPHTSVRSTIEIIEKEGQLPKKDRVMVGVKKERENKIKGRVFVKMTRRGRQFQTATEYNLGHELFKYIKNQSMNMTEKEFIHTLANLNKDFVKEDTSNCLFISFDFSKWCLTMTDQALTDFFTCLDDIFGLRGVYEYSQKFPQQCLYLFQDRFFPPKIDKITKLPKEGKASVYHMNKWLEGMKQKGWTVFTSMIILDTAVQLGTTASIMGQGDNQVVVLKLPDKRVLHKNKQTPTDYATAFIAQLEKNSSKLGMKLKPEETWSSSILFEYSKKYYYKGVEVSQGLKTASRIGQDTNDDFDTLTNSVAGSFSSGVNIASRDHSPIPGYILACVNASLDLEIRLGLKVNETVAFLLGNRSVGMLPTVTFESFMVRGVQDPLSSCISVIKYCYRHFPAIAKVFSFILDLRQYRPDPKLLIKDPLALAIKIPQSAESAVRNLLRESLPAAVKNEVLRPLFDVSAKDAESDLIADLWSMNPKNIKVMHNLYKSSSIALREKYIGRFAVSRSIRDILRHVVDLNNTEFREMIEMYDEGVITFYQGKIQRMRANKKIRLQSLKDVFLGCDSSCSRVIAQHLRDETWGSEIVGVTMPAPHEQVLIHRWMSNTRFGRAFNITVTPGATHKRRGPHNPYIGSKTQKKTAKSSLEVIEVNSTVRAMQDLLQLGLWTVTPGEENLSDLVMNLYREKSDIPVSVFEDVVKVVVGGSVSHRLTCDAIKVGTFHNGLINFNTFCYINTDVMTHYAKSTDDYTLCMQTAMLVSQARLNLLRICGVIVEGDWACEVICDDCTIPVPPDQCSLPQEPRYKGLPGMPKCNKIMVRSRSHQVSNKRLGDRVHYSIHAAWKWAYLVMRSRTIYTDGNLYSDRPGEVPDFVNLTEYCRMDVDFFLNTLIIAIGSLCRSAFDIQAFVLDLQVFDKLEAVKSLYTTLNKAGLFTNAKRILHFHDYSFSAFRKSFLRKLQALGSAKLSSKTAKYCLVTPYQTPHEAMNMKRLMRERGVRCRVGVCDGEVDAVVKVRKTTRVTPATSVRHQFMNIGDELEVKNLCCEIEKCYYAHALDADGQGIRGLVSLSQLNLRGHSTTHLVSIGDTHGELALSVLRCGLEVDTITCIPKKKGMVNSSSFEPSALRLEYEGWALTDDQIRAWTDHTQPNGSMYVLADDKHLRGVPIGAEIIVKTRRSELPIIPICVVKDIMGPFFWVFGILTDRDLDYTDHLFRDVRLTAMLSSRERVLTFLQTVHNNYFHNHRDNILRTWEKFVGCAFNPDTIAQDFNRRLVNLKYSIEREMWENLYSKDRAFLKRRGRSKVLSKLMAEMSHLYAFAETLRTKRIYHPPSIHLHSMRNRRKFFICPRGNCGQRLYRTKPDLNKLASGAIWAISELYPGQCTVVEIPKSIAKQCAKVDDIWVG
ncbi:RNA-dependent RNA polymerase [Beihai rhabdo-like virus 4]|uniref:RNA-directed RNA polymerase n=1 Tax=Beihai rhabdo-like virus 4 TaxID=1922654 RepID=A0A1L3KMN2_9MONO|nr:RNA-dependent RNA polymerase [Beihai rhabdo-like virus 4]APG78642.1 RNA-dependent RNA polymerase [Beihai rhabdo-like virus 4]